MKEYDWLEPTLDRVAALLRMPDKHNSYGTPKVEPASAWFALSAVFGSNLRTLPTPEILPVDGGLKFTWQGTSMECSLSVTPIPESTGGVFDVDVSARRGDVELSNKESLLEILGEISRELTLAETKP